MKERIEQVLNDLDTTLTADLKALRPEQRVELWAKLQEFIRPKLSRTALAADNGPAPQLGFTLHHVTGYLDRGGNFVKSPPLARSEADTDWEIAEEERTAAGAPR